MRSLPGESLMVTHFRLMDACMDAFDETKYQLMEIEAEGTKSTQRVYPEASMAHHDACDRQVKAALPLPVLSKQDLEDGYRRLVGVVACLHEKGHDVGSVVSHEEFIAKQANVTYSSKWLSAVEEVGFAEHIGVCDALAK